jgi:hypothetical protein
MAKKTEIKNENIDSIQEIDDTEALEEAELTLVDEVDAAEEIELADIPIEEFLKDPQKMAKLTEEAEIEESTNWCPQCSDHTIFVDRVCTVCGFTKGSRKSDDKDDKDGESDVSFELLPEDELVEDLGYSGYNDENGDDY